jgi:hypothetical protein
MVWQLGIFIVPQALKCVIHTIVFYLYNNKSGNYEY